MKECMKIRKGLSALTMALTVMGMLGIGAVEEIKEQIVVEASTRAYSCACLDGAQKEIMTVAYTSTVYNAKDYNTLCRIVEAEAGGEDTVGKIMVANVILNRVSHSKFPDTVTDVVYASGQFSPVSSGKINRVNISADTRAAVKRALGGEDYSNGALYFAARRYAASSNMRWFDKSLTKVAVHGGHEFYTL